MTWSDLLVFGMLPALPSAATWQPIRHTLHYFVPPSKVLALKKRWKLDSPDFVECYREWIFAHIAKMPSGCWQWTGQNTGLWPGAYGQCYVPTVRKLRLAHRVVYNLE